MLERSQVSAEALRIQSAIRDEALKLADLACAAQQSASVALGVVAQTGIVPLTGLSRSVSMPLMVSAAVATGREFGVGSFTTTSISWPKLIARQSS